jgi:tetratricopeptide (TPR) repeat protein
MSIHLPFTPNELKNLHEIFQKNGWQLNTSITNNFRYSLKKEKLIILTIRFPVAFPVRINIPIEILNFRLSIAFKIWDLNQSTNRLILYLIKMLRDLAIQVSIEHSLSIEGKEKQLVDLLNLLIPDVINEESENTWINRIRISLMTKRDGFNDREAQMIDQVINAIRTSQLIATFKLPWELKEGVPKLRTAESLFFSNDEPYDEFFIIEKGFITYFKDLEYNKFYMRSSFDSYTPYILFKLLDDNIVTLENLVDNWIKFSRMMLNSLIEIIDSAKINQQDLMQFNYERELSSNGFEEEKNCFPLTPLHYESSISKGELYQIHNDLFNSPPTNFEVIESIQSYTEAEELITNYRFDDATELLNQSLKVFNKNRQKKIVVSILLKLYHIASTMNRDVVALNYLESALSVAKSGEVPIGYIMKTHYKLGLYHYKRKKNLDAEQHFNVIVSFLEKEEPSINVNELLGLSYLYLGLIFQEEEQHSQAKSFFRQTLKLAENAVKVKIYYYLLQAKQFKDKGNLSHSQKLLKSGIDAVGIEFNETANINPFFDLVLELAEFYIHQRIDSRKSLYLLKKIEDRVSSNVKKISGIRRAIRWNLLMSDYFDSIIKNSKNSSYYYKQAQIFINQLKKLGIPM